MGSITLFLSHLQEESHHLGNARFIFIVLEWFSFAENFLNPVIFQLECVQLIGRV